MSNYIWHPLYIPFCKILDYYQEITQGVDSKNNFSYILSYLWDCYDGKEKSEYCGELDLLILLKKFDPLIINCKDNLVLFKYKDYIALSDLGLKDNFWDIYDGMYLECRSVVMDTQTREIVLAPQAKFFNVNERVGWEEKTIKDKIAKSKLIEISNKLDGSNQNYCYYNGAIIGSGSSAIDKELSWRLTRGYELLTENYKNMLKSYPNRTFMFEFISPENQVVVHYNKSQEGLYLFGMRDNFTGKQYSYIQTLEIAKKFNVLTTELYNDSFDNILTKLDDYSCEEKEGWVISIIDKDNHVFKAKLKINDYVLMHRAIGKLISPNSIIEAIAENKWDDFFPKIPEGYKQNALVIYNTVINYIKTMDARVKCSYKQVYNALGEDFYDTKTFMIYIKENYKGLESYLIKCYKGQNLNFLKKGNNGYKRLNELVINT